MNIGEESVDGHNMIKHQAFNSLSFRNSINKLCYNNDKFEKYKYSYAVKKCQITSVKPKTYNIYGVILRCVIKETQYFGLVQGRLTGKWSFPKGHSKEGETSTECIKRELQEETGLNLEHLPKESYTVCLQFGQYIVIDLDTEVALTPGDTKEIMETRWVSSSEMRDMRLNADVTEFMKSYIMK